MPEEAQRSPQILEETRIRMLHRTQKERSNRWRR